MFEIFGKNLILKQFLIFDNEAISVIGPLDDMTVLFLFKDLVCLDDEVGDLLLAMDSFLTSNHL